MLSNRTHQDVPFLGEPFFVVHFSSYSPPKNLTEAIEMGSVPKLVSAEKRPLKGKCSKCCYETIRADNDSRIPAEFCGNW